MAEEVRKVRLEGSGDRQAGWSIDQETAFWRMIEEYEREADVREAGLGDGNEWEGDVRERGIGEIDVGEGDEREEIEGVRMRIMMMRRWKGRPQEKRAGYKRV